MTSNMQLLAVHEVYDTIDPTKELKDSAQGKVVLITGAGRGIGQAIAKAFTIAGAKALILTAYEDSELEDTKKIVQKIRPEIEVFYRAFDVRDKNEVERFIKDAAEWSQQRIDVLCANAGHSPPLVEIADSDPDRWWLGFEINLKGAYLFARYVLPIMRKQKSGHVIITSSRATVAVESLMSSYQISKLAVTRLADCLDEENQQYGIKTFAIHPGGIITRLLTDMEAHKDDPTMSIATSYIRPKLSEDISLPGNVCVFLASGKADFLSGRYIDATIDFREILKNKDIILKRDLFKVGVPLNWDESGGAIVCPRN
ncbi:putative short chain dehydrogenase reductase [Phaeomoniella chlamydospora]|uniref:Putative short chain dehydrogenase reductase n=1 Tax=Phaeomoniella chlamydospora TaxID=158046 RepID=A0A0G2DYX4_PHACM|nr:putative short chain dehydrogenase reductase [Phaeomoniella chlamydospora]